MAELSHQSYTLGRAYTVSEVIVIARRATFDPGEFVKRRINCDGELETLERWQARAVATALGPHGPAFEHRWSNLAQAVDGLAPGEIDAVLSGGRKAVR